MKRKHKMISLLRRRGDPWIYFDGTHFYLNQTTINNKGLSFLKAADAEFIFKNSYLFGYPVINDDKILPCDYDFSPDEICMMIVKWSQNAK